MQITIAAKRRKGEWRAAHIVDNVFEDALFNLSISDLIIDAAGPVLAQEYADGTEISVNITTLTPAEIAAIKKNKAKSIIPEPDA